jgi:hypothetical protein
MASSSLRQRVNPHAQSKRPAVGLTTKVSRQALSERFLSSPYTLFEGVFHTLVPRLKAQWAQRSRPLSTSVAYGMKHFEQIWAEIRLRPRSPIS